MEPARIISIFLKNSVTKSKIGNVLVENTQGFAGSINGVFGGAVNETLSFLTVEPKSDSLVKLNFSTSKFSIDSVVDRILAAAKNKQEEGQ